MLIFEASRTTKRQTKMTGLKAYQTKPKKVRIRRSTGRVTLADVALVAHVSQQTISRVLNTPGTVALETRNKVLAAVKMLGYLPLKSNALQPKKRVAVLIPALSGTIFDVLIQSLNTTLGLHNFQMVLNESGYANKDEDLLLEELLQSQPDGIVLARLLKSESALEKLHQSGLPVVEVWGTTPTPIDMLFGFSHEAIGEAVAHYFKALGRNTPALLSGDDPRTMQRAQGFLGALKNLNLLLAGAEGSPVVWVSSPTSLGDGRAGLAQLLKQIPTLDCVFCSTDMVAMGVLIEAKSRGLKVPEDIAVFGFGDLPFSADTDPPLSTVRVDGAAIGQRAAQALIDRIEGRTVARPVLDMGFNLIRRLSA